MWKNHEYSEELTKEYLEQLGIVGMTGDGSTILKIHKKTGKLLFLQTKGRNSSGYLIVQMYDPDLRKLTPLKERNTSTGCFVLPLHRIVYAWFYGKASAGMVIDHIDNNKDNNLFTNLREITPQENLTRDTSKNTKLVKCRLDKPLSYYEEKLAAYERLYEDAKLNKDANEAHKQRANIANCRARIRYYKKMKGEVE
jgi:hypothetical protein